MRLVRRAQARRSAGTRHACSPILKRPLLSAQLSAQANAARLLPHPSTHHRPAPSWPRRNCTMSRQANKQQAVLLYNPRYCTSRAPLVCYSNKCSHYERLLQPLGEVQPLVQLPPVVAPAQRAVRAPARRGARGLGVGSRRPSFRARSRLHSLLLSPLRQGAPARPRPLLRTTLSEEVQAGTSPRHTCPMASPPPPPHKALQPLPLCV